MRWTTYKKAIIHKIDTEKNETEHGISYEVFKNIPELAQLTNEHLYKQVWVVSEPRTTSVKLIKFKDGNPVLKFSGEIPARTYFPNEVMLHPDEWEDNRPKQKKKKK